MSGINEEENPNASALENISGSQNPISQSIEGVNLTSIGNIKKELIIT